MEYDIAYKDKNSVHGHWHSIRVRGYGALLLENLLKENGYEYTVTGVIHD